MKTSMVTYAQEPALEPLGAVPAQRGSLNGAGAQAEVLASQG
jgi:hypothetical protein